uniref:Aspartic protease n=1 Tax=Fagopyrum esculentum TaxID=3617 RepID=Q6QJL5_FAGES|nr:aspartic protease [Fagopyrum esculentum]ABB88696.2 aspartic proteinase-like protein [Fagopyrum esculentum]
MPTSLLFLLFLLLQAASAAAATFPLSISPSALDKWESINLAALSSLSRARHLKRPPTLTGKVTLPAYPRSYGGYSVIFSLGTPPQKVSLVLDTGSSLVWTPCTIPTATYTCQNCTFSGVDPTKIPIYARNKSSTVQSLPCRSPKCNWVFGSDLNCSTTKRCPYYGLEYGLGSTTGQLVSDVLGLSKLNRIPDFLFGCSLVSNRQPEGIAGFGRGLASIPAQLGLTKFSYCLVSHRFDDTPQSGDLVLHRGRRHADAAANGVAYAPFTKSPALSPYSEYYYISLSKILVGGKDVPIPPRYLVPSKEGDGGMIVDSGSTFTFMERIIFDPVARELEKHMTKYKRAKEIEDSSGLGPCYNITGQSEVDVPKLTFSFKGGANMDLPLTDYFSLVTDGVVCMTVLTDPDEPGSTTGPAIILGNYQQQNFYIEYDLKKQRFGFKPQQCDRSKN